MLLGFLHKCKHTRHIQRRTPFNLLLVLKFQSTRTTQGIFYLIIFNVLLSYHIKLFFAIVFFIFHNYFTISLFNNFFLTLPVPTNSPSSLYILYCPSCKLCDNLTPLKNKLNFFSFKTILLFSP